MGMSSSETAFIFFQPDGPTSTGGVTLRSANPLDPPAFQFNFLSTEEDRRAAIDAVRAIRTVVAQAAWSELRGEEVTPGRVPGPTQRSSNFSGSLRAPTIMPAVLAMGSDERGSWTHRHAVRGLKSLRHHRRLDSASDRQRQPQCACHHDSREACGSDTRSGTARKRVGAVLSGLRNRVCGPKPAGAEEFRASAQVVSKRNKG